MTMTEKRPMLIGTTWNNFGSAESSNVFILEINAIHISNRDLCMVLLCTSILVKLVCCKSHSNTLAQLGVIFNTRKLIERSLGSVLGIYSIH